MKRKLTYATAQAIREYHSQTKATPSQIVRHFNLLCSDSAVYAIITNRTYRTRKQKTSSKVVLDNQKVRNIKGLLHNGRKTEYCALMFGVSNSTIQRIKYGLTWRDTK